MTGQNFVNYHILVSHSPACLNRDDMNMQKDAIFGGVRRVRYSSQSLKRAIRKSDYYEKHLGEESRRTRELGHLKKDFVEALKDRYPAELVSKAMDWIAGAAIGDDNSATAVAPWALPEVAHFCEIIQNEPDLDERKLQKRIEKESAAFNAALRNTVDIALSGRMATSGLMTSVDGALSVAHVITTHKVDSDIDWFTAMDDLIEEQRAKERTGTSENAEKGAGHLNTQEFSSGVFYRYASLDLRQLQKNLGGGTREEALGIAAHVLHMLATVTPAAKQKSFAAHNPADFALVSLSDQPISLANAFETPIKAKDRGLFNPSVESLLRYWQAVHRGFGIAERTALFETRPLDVTKTKDGDKKDMIEKPNPKASLVELCDWLRQDGK